MVSRAAELLFLVAALAAASLRPLAAAAREVPGLVQRQLLATNLSSWADPGTTYVPVAGPGSWDSGISTGLILIHANLMKGGSIVGWSNRNNGFQEFGSAVYDPATRIATQLLGECGLHDCKNAFCSGHVTTPMSDVLIFGGHADDLQWFRSYSHANRSVWSTTMSSGRWYATAATLPDGRVAVVGGVADSGTAGYHAVDDQDLDNPTYEVYDPADRSWSGDKDDMRAQLSAAFPIHTYPLVILTPDGGLAVSAGRLLVKYARSGPTSFKKEFDFQPRPGPPWSYPQTGLGVPLPMFPPYDTMYLLATGGSAEDEAKPNRSPASNAAQLIELTGGAGASWREVGPMPHARVMGDAVILCDGTIGIFGGAGVGIAGWLKDNPRNVEFKDGSSWYCEERCSKADEPVYEPTIFNPHTGQWTEKGSLAEAQRPRLYHSIAILQPDCKVLTAGSDVTWDQTGEVWTPPYFSRGPQPVISSAPSFVKPGDLLTIPYTSADPVTRAILIRNGAVSHSMSFDARALWLAITSDSGSALKIQMPGSSSVVPPGMYMLVILSDKGVPSSAKIMSVMLEDSWA